MTGWTILLLAFAVAWLCMLGVVWLLCWAAARADKNYRAVSAMRAGGERRATVRR
jgi:hypothetical protein